MIKKIINRLTDVKYRNKPFFFFFYLQKICLIFFKNNGSLVSISFPFFGFKMNQLHHYLFVIEKSVITRSRNQ